MSLRKFAPGFLIVVFTAVAAADWPVFRGNSLQDGASTEKLPEKLTELWRYQTGDSIEGAPAIVDGVVFIGSMDQHLHAVDMKAGMGKWKFKAGPFKVPIAVRKGRVYAGDLDGAFFCLDAATGKEKWKFATESEVSSGANFADERILFGSGDESVYCLDAHGKKVWQFKVPGGPVMGTPPVADGKTYVSGCDSKLHVVNVANGEELASIDLDGQAGATPAVRGDMLYLGTMSNSVLGIDVKKKEVSWSFASSRNQPFYASAAVSDKHVVAGCRDKRIYGLDRQTGKQVWDFVTEGRIEGSPVIVGDRVYAGSMDGNLYVLDLSSGKQLQQIKLDSAVTGSIAVADKKLFVGTEKGTLYCFGAKE